MPKKPIEQWKECGLKSLFLLKDYIHWVLTKWRTI